jgi:hypothetical protein
MENELIFTAKSHVQFLTDVALKITSSPATGAAPPLHAETLEAKSQPVADVEFQTCVSENPVEKNTDKNSNAKISFILFIIPPPMCLGL